MSKVDWGSLPVGADPKRDIPWGQDELGNTQYRMPNGRTYVLKAGAPRERKGAAGSRERLVDVLGNLVRGAAQGVGQAITSPRRALDGETMTNADMMATAGMVQLGGAAMPAPRGSLRSAAMRAGGEAAETTAQKVARMLREGRAADVTDDMMAAVDPQEMHRLYTSGATGADMPMDTASRMARARDMYRAAVDGADDAYIGFRTVEDPAAFTTRSFVWDDGTPTRRKMSGTSATDVFGSPDRAEGMHRLGPRRSNDGYYFGDYTAVLGSKAATPGVDDLEIVMRNPRTIFARNRADARFDPRLSHLSNLNAANASPTAGLFGMQAAGENELIEYLKRLR